MNRKELAKMMAAYAERPEVKRRTSFHEGGHAAMHWFFGTYADFYKIDMRGTVKLAAYIRRKAFQDNPTVLLAHAKFFPALGRAKAAEAMMHHLAGPCAANRAGEQLEDWLGELEEEAEWGDEEPFDESLDVVRAIRIAKVICGDTDDGTGADFQYSRRVSRYLRQIAAWTDEALADNRLWAVVTALAARLASVKTLGPRRAWGVMAKAWGNDESRAYWTMGRKWRRRLAPGLPKRIRERMEGEK